MSERIFHSSMADKYLRNSTKLMMLEVDSKLCREFGGEYFGSSINWPDFMGHPGTMAFLVFEFSQSGNLPRCVSMPIQMPCTKVKTIRNMDGLPFDVDADPVQTSLQFDKIFTSVDLTIRATRAIYARRQEASK
jgi:hypothetical protein